MADDRTLKHSASLPGVAGQPQYCRWWQSIQAKLLGLALLGTVSVALAVGSLMLATADGLFLKHAQADLDRQNQALANELNFLIETASGALTTTAHDSAFQFYFDDRYRNQRDAFLEQIQARLKQLHQTYHLDEACLIDTHGVERARETGGQIASADELSANEASTPFFAPALLLPPGQLYRSPVPYRSEDIAEWAVAFATPLPSAQGSAIGLLHIELPLRWFAERVSQTTGRDQSAAYSFLMTRDGRLLLHPQIKPLDDSTHPDLAFPTVAQSALSASLGELAARVATEPAGQTRFTDDAGSTHEVIYRPVYGGQWVVATVLADSAIYQSGSELWRDTAMAAAPMVILALLFMAVQARRLIGPLRQMTVALDALAEGDVSPVVTTKRRDELGTMATALERMANYHRRMARIADGIANGNLDQTIVPNSARDGLGQAFVTMNDGLRALLNDVKQTQARFRSLIENIRDVVLLLSADGIVMYASPATIDLLGVEPETMVGQKLADYLQLEDSLRFRLVFDEVAAQPSENLGVAEMRLQHADGSWRLCRLRLVNRLDSAEVCGLIGTLHDISERQDFEEQLAHRAFHDALTGLPNRALFRNRLEQALTHRLRTQRRVAVMFIDLDNFKVVNDSLGHQAGDTLLVRVAERIKSCLRACDTVARQGGDEFTVLLEDCKTPDDAQEVAERLIDRLREPFEIDGNEIVAQGSIGIAISGDGPEPGDDMLRNADTAMYRAKANGKGRFAFFDPAMMDSALARLRIESELRHAIERDELLLHYQPVVELESGRLLELEVLIRWNHPQNGLVPPVKFIPIAEETGLIVPIGEWVLRKACEQLRQWQLEHVAAATLRIAVNLSLRQFRQNNLAESVATILRETGLAPECLKLEITESMVMSEPESTIESLWKLKELGISLAVDDFGTGYSSLAYLKCLPIDVLKIDRSFVDGLCREGEDAAIVKAIIALAHSLNLGITAEGIETGEQAETLLDLACRQGQGYFYGRPVPDQAITALLAKSADPSQPALSLKVAS